MIDIERVDETNTMREAFDYVCRTALVAGEDLAAHEDHIIRGLD